MVPPSPLRACGHVGCCDSSPSQHASRHAAEAGHAIAQSYEPGEDWFWDYATDEYVEGPALRRHGTTRSTSRSRDPRVGCPGTGSAASGDQRGGRVDATGSTGSGDDHRERGTTPARWPELPWRDWEPTISTLHMWVQIVGKVRLALAPPLNHWWQVPLYVTARGLTTSPIPYGDRAFQVDFDFVEHRLAGQRRRPRVLRDGPRAAVGRAVLPRVHGRAPKPRHRRRHLAPSGGGRRRHPVRPGRAACLLRPAPRAAVVAGAVQVDRVMKVFQTGFVGKASPVHFFWGGFDLATTRFSGRPAPRHPGGIPNCPDWVMEEAESHQNVTVGWWPLSDAPGPAFFAYAYPEPEGFRSCRRPSRPTRSSTIASASSCCRTTPSGPPPIRTRPSSSSCGRPTRRAPTWAAGTARPSSRPSCLGRPPRRPWSLGR